MKMLFVKKIFKIYLRLHSTFACLNIYILQIILEIFLINYIIIFLKLRSTPLNCDLLWFVNIILNYFIIIINKI